LKDELYVRLIWNGMDWNTVTHQRWNGWEMIRLNRMEWNEMRWDSEVENKRRYNTKQRKEENRRGEWKGKRAISGQTEVNRG
jgi:hypothetical protein